MTHEYTVRIHLPDGFLDVRPSFRYGVHLRAPRKREHGYAGFGFRHLRGVRSSIDPRLADVVLSALKERQLLAAQVLLRPELHILRHSEGYLGESSGEGSDKGAVASQRGSPPDCLLPGPGLSNGTYRPLEGNAVVRLAVALGVGPIMVRHELPLEHRGHNLRSGRVHLSHLPEEGVAQFPLKPVSRVRGIGNVIVHRLGKES